MGKDRNGLRELKSIVDSFSFSAEKSVNELDAVRILLRQLDVNICGLQSCGTKDPPDARFEHDGKIVGIEVVALVHRYSRERNLEVKDALRRYQFHFWTKAEFQRELDRIVATKNHKLCKGIADDKCAKSCSEFWLLVHCDEVTLTSYYVEDYLQNLSLPVGLIKRSFLLLAPEAGRPSSERYPLYDLTDNLIA